LAEVAGLPVEVVGPTGHVFTPDSDDSATD